MDPQEVEVVLVTAADDAANTMALARRALQCAIRVRQSDALEVRMAVTNVDVGQGVRRDQVAAARAGCVIGVVLQTARYDTRCIGKRAADIAALSVAEQTDHPGRGELK